MAIARVDQHVIDLSYGGLSSVLHIDWYALVGDHSNVAVDLSHNELFSIRDLPRDGCGGRITRLDVSHNHLTSLEGCPDVFELDCSYNMLQTLEGAPSTVVKLNARSNVLKDVYQCPQHIRWLDVAKNRIEHDSLQALPPSIHTLYISNNRIDQVKNLKHLSCLRKIEIGYNALWSLQGLPPAIEYVDVDGNRELTSLEGLSRHVTFVSASHCALSDLTSCPESIKHLEISNNPIGSWRGADRLTCVHTLVANMTQFFDMRGTFSSLRRVWMDDSTLVSWKGLPAGVVFLSAERSNLKKKYNNLEVGAVQRLLRNQLFRKGIRKLQAVYADRCARIIQRVWEGYWWNEWSNGSNRHARYCMSLFFSDT